MFYVYYLLAVGSGDLLYIGRSATPHKRKMAFERRTGISVEFGLHQRHSDLGAACKAELAAIAKHWPPYNKSLSSTKGRCGLVSSEEHVRKMRAALVGRSLPESAKIKMSLAKIGQVPHNKGKPLSAEARANLSAKIKGRPIPAELKERIRQALIGRPCSPETRAKIGASNKLRHQERTT